MAQSVKVEQPFLFFDDEFIADQRGLRRRMGKPVKDAGNPILGPETPWEGKCVLIWGSVLWDRQQDLFKMWYEAYNPPRGLPWSTILCYAESRDGLSWQRPNLGLYEYDGSRENNLVFVPPSGKGFDAVTVAIDPFDPPEDQRFKMTMFRKGEGEHRHVRFASADGIHWNELGPLRLPVEVGDVCSLMPDAEHGRWNFYYKKSGPRTVCLATSDDFEHWTDHGEVLVPNEADPPRTQFYGMVGFRDRGWGIGFLQMFHIIERRLDTQLVRIDEQGVPHRFSQGEPFLERGAWSEWDHAWAFPGNGAPIRVGEEVRIYYQGRRTLHWAGPPYGTGHIGAIGLARLRPDGWVYLEATEAQAELTTVPLEATGPVLCVNADASGGEVRAELLDAAGRRIDGCEAQRCWPLRSDATYFMFNWDRQSFPETLVGKPVRVRLHADRAKLYSLWFSSGQYSNG